MPIQARPSCPNVLQGQQRDLEGKGKDEAAGEGKKLCHEVIDLVHDDSEIFVSFLWWPFTLTACGGGFPRFWVSFGIEFGASSPCYCLHVTASTVCVLFADTLAMATAVTIRIIVPPSFSRPCKESDEERGSAISGGKALMGKLNH